MSRKGQHFNIPDDIQMYIAEKSSSSNIRELKAPLTKVSTR